jgi:hypothetical protein
MFGWRIATLWGDAYPKGSVSDGTGGEEIARK